MRIKIFFYTISCHSDPLINVSIFLRMFKDPVCFACIGKLFQFTSINHENTNLRCKFDADRLLMLYLVIIVRKSLLIQRAFHVLMNISDPKHNSFIWKIRQYCSQNNFFYLRWLVIKSHYLKSLRTMASCLKRTGFER